jgi:hypothetical protein
MVWAGIVAEPPAAPLPPALRPLHGGDVILLGLLAGLAVLVWLIGWRWARGSRRARLDPASPGAGSVLALVLSVSTLLVWFVNPYAALMLLPALHLWLLASIADVPRRGPVPLVLALGGLVPFAIVVLYYLDKLSINPLEGVWYLFLLVASGDVGLFACLCLCLLVGVFGSLVAVLVARARKPPPARVEIPDQPSVFGPGGYAGPGALGGTSSAARR